MIRVVLFLVLVALVAVGAAWLADRPGDVIILWLGRRIETSVMVTAAGLALAMALAVFLWWLGRLAWRSPRLVGRAMGDLRQRRAHRAISHGLIAIGAGDARAAQKYAAEAGRLAPHEPLALLLNAQVAQVSGDRAAAEQAFRAMAERSDTRLIGLRGLHVEAERRDDIAAARHFAEAAAHAAPALPWAGEAVLRDCCAAGDWGGALAALERIRRGGLLDKAGYRRQRAVVLTARANALADTDTAGARRDALEAQKLAPDLVPAAALAARLSAQAGDYRKATKILETGWRAGPHPDLAEVAAHLRSGDTARDRLKRVETLVRERPNHAEGAIAVARAAIDAQEFATARAALMPLTAAPTQRVALLMAELEEAEHGDVGRAREWMTRALRAARDPAWIADGIVSDHWLPMSPVSGRLDAFQWRDPPGELTGAASGARLIGAGEASEVIEAAPAATPAAPTPAADARAADHNRGGAAAADVSDTPAPPAAPPPASPPPQERPPVVDAVIPLVHAPDDPGPPEPPEPELPARGRRRLFFR